MRPRSCHSFKVSFISRQRSDLLHLTSEDLDCSVIWGYDSDKDEGVGSCALFDRDDGINNKTTGPKEIMQQGECLRSRPNRNLIRDKFHVCEDHSYINKREAF